MSTGFIRQARCTGLLLAALLVGSILNGWAGFSGAVLAQQEPGTQVNVELIMDSSGSMAEETNTGEPRIDAAKRVLNEVIDAIPEDRPEINVGFRVFGHKGDNTPGGKTESCQSSDLTVPIDGVDKDALREQVDDYAPVGWTPIGLSLERAAGDFPDAADGVVNAVILVTDGLETCDRDPCRIATLLKQGPAAVTVYVVGLGLDDEELRVTSCIADNTGGRIVGAQNAAELSDALFTFLEELQVVVVNGTLEIESIGGVYPLADVSCAGSVPSDSDPEGGEPFTAAFTADSNVLEIPAGLCDVTWSNPSGEATTIQVEVVAEERTFIRGSILAFPHGAGEIYLLTASDGTVIWRDQIESGDDVWVLPGIYRLAIEELTGDAVLLSMQVQTLPGSVTQVSVTTAP